MVKEKHVQIYKRDFTSTFTKFLETISGNEREIIKDLFDELEIELSEARLLKYLTIVKLAKKCGFSFVSRGKDSIKSVIKNILQMDVGYETKVTYLIIFRSLLKRLIDPNCDMVTKYIKLVKQKINSKAKLRGKELTPEEVHHIISHARSLRMRTILSILADTGMRIGELLSLQLKDIKLYDNYFLLAVESGKTKNSVDFVPLPREASYLTFGGYSILLDWLNHTKVPILYNINDSGRRVIKGEAYEAVLHKLKEHNRLFKNGFYEIDGNTYELELTNLFRAKQIAPDIFLFHKRSNPWKPPLWDGLARELRREVKELKDLHLIPPEKVVTFHSFRHTRAYLMIRYDRMNLDSVKTLLRHADIKTTASYYDYSIDDFIEDKISNRVEKQVW